MRRYNGTHELLSWLLDTSKQDQQASTQNTISVDSHQISL